MTATRGRIAMGRRKKKRTRKQRPPKEYMIFYAPDQMFELDPEVAERLGVVRRRWALAKSILICSLTGGLVGAAIDAALGTDGYALPAAMIGGIPMGVVGATLLGSYGRRFGAINRIRHGGAVGAALGLLVGGSFGMAAGLSAWAFVWSLPGVVAGAAIQWAVTGRGRIGFRLWSGAVVGALIGILARVIQIGPPGVMMNAIDGTVVGAVLGALVIPALLALIDRTPEVR